jgi:hypothetical protein
MKKSIFNPGFEFIFTLSILAVLGLPPLVSAQNTKDIQISIANGDTTVNGKDIKTLSPKERRDAMKDITNISSINSQPMANAGRMNPPMMNFHRRPGKDSTVTLNYRMRMDTGRRMAMRKFQDMRMRGDRMPGRNPAMEFDHKNSQVFNFVTTDNNGVSTHVSYRVSEPTDGLTHMGTDPDQQAQHEKLDMTDLNIVPEFSAGKTILMFTLPTKIAADVQFEDSKGNLIWREKAMNGSFMKSFPLGLNGIYYLRVEQKGHLAVRKIFKEQM